MLLLDVVFPDFEDPEEHSEVLQRKTVFWRQVLVVFAREHPGVELGENFAELNVVKLLALEEFIDAQLEQEQCVV